MAPYTPREPEEVALTMQAFAGSKLAGTCTIITTFCLPLPSSATAMYSVPAMRPSPPLSLPSLSILGP